jgi:molybdopterin/thiamine biosynthesis adenylyltransferase/ubiquitin-protein ligase
MSFNIGHAFFDGN